MITVHDNNLCQCPAVTEIRNNYNITGVTPLHNEYYLECLKSVLLIIPPWFSKVNKGLALMAYFYSIYCNSSIVTKNEILLPSLLAQSVTDSYLFLYNFQYIMGIIAG